MLLFSENKVKIKTKNHGEILPGKTPQSCPDNTEHYFNWLSRNFNFEILESVEQQGNGRGFRC